MINLQLDMQGTAANSSYPISLTAGNTVQFYVSSGSIYGSTGTGGIASKGRYSIALMNQNANLAIGQATGMGVPNKVVITSATNWSVPSGVTQIQVEAVGAGGSGTGCYVSQAIGGGGGGAGGYLCAIIPVTSGSTINITSVATGGVSSTGSTGLVAGNAGGNTVFSFSNNGSTSVATANGGYGGGAVTFSTINYPTSATGGQGGLPQITNAGSLVYYVVQGGAGAPGYSGYTNVGYAVGGNGGSSFFGGGGQGRVEADGCEEGRGDGKAMKATIKAEQKRAIAAKTSSRVGNSTGTPPRCRTAATETAPA
jgi:hypothetical protein